MTVSLSFAIGLEKPPRFVNSVLSQGGSDIQVFVEGNIVNQDIRSSDLDRFRAIERRDSRRRSREVQLRFLLACNIYESGKVGQFKVHLYF